MKEQLKEKEIYDFEKWMEKIWKHVPPQSRISKAISYKYTLLPRLSRYVNDGRILLDKIL